MSEIGETESVKENKDLIIKESEKKLVLNNPEKVGINFDHEFIVDARNYWSHDHYLQYIKERDGEISEEIKSMVDTGESKAILLKKEKEESQKQEAFIKYLNSFWGKLQHVRIHPTGETSPLTPSQSIETKPDGTYNISLSPKFIEQIKNVQEKVKDLTLVVQFYDHRRVKEHASDVPEPGEQTEQYIMLCENIIQEFGDEIQLEIGNETNISRNTDDRFEGKLQHTSHVNSVEYGNFYFNVTRKLKEKYPNLKLSIAGVACYDPTYLSEVLSEIDKLKKENKIKTNLVDTISFHPYRDIPEVGSIEVKNGEFAQNNLNYEEQLTEMKEIALSHGVNLTVGEINFKRSDPEQQAKLEKSIDISTKSNVVSLIYPGNHVE